MASSLGINPAVTTNPSDLLIVMADRMDVEVVVEVEAKEAEVVEMKQKPLVLIQIRMVNLQPSLPNRLMIPCKSIKLRCRLSIKTPLALKGPLVKETTQERPVPRKVEEMAMIEMTVARIEMNREASKIVKMIEMRAINGLVVMIEMMTMTVRKLEPMNLLIIAIKTPNLVIVKEMMITITNLRLRPSAIQIVAIQRRNIVIKTESVKEKERRVEIVSEKGKKNDLVKKIEITTNLEMIVIRTEIVREIEKIKIARRTEKKIETEIEIEIVKKIERRIVRRRSPWKCTMLSSVSNNEKKSVAEMEKTLPVANIIKIEAIEIKATPKIETIHREELFDIKSAFAHEPFFCLVPIVVI
jgi:hypothetical protein